MFGRLDGRSIFATTLLLLSTAIAIDAMAMPYGLEREEGIGGGPGAGASPAKVTSRQDAQDRTRKSIGVTIEIEREEGPVIRAAEGVPVSPFVDEPAVQPKAVSDQPLSRERALVAVAHEEAAAAAAELKVSRDHPVEPVLQTAPLADVRSQPISAQDLLREEPAPKVSIQTTEVAALPNSTSSPRPATQPLSQVVNRPAPKPIEQAQLAPNAIAAPRSILPPLTTNTPVQDAALPVFAPSPQKPQPPQVVQPVAIAPNVAASPKASVLRQAPTPSNEFVELVQPPTDLSVTVAAGTSQLLNSSKPVYNIIASDPNVANAYAISPTQIAVHGIGLGSTNMFGIGDGGQVVFAINVDTVPNAGFAQSQLQAAAPGSGANVALESGRLTARGQVSGVGDAINVQNVAYGLEQTQGPTVNNTTIEGSQQVRIQVRFAEVSRNDVFNLGINWSAIFDGSDFLFGLATGNFLSAAGDLSAREIASLDGEEFGRVDFNGEFGDFNVDAFIDALQREGIVNLLAEPNLTSVNGEPASFVAGGEVPIPVPGGAGGDTVTIDYKQFGVLLDFVPTLLPGGRINLRVRPEVSTIASSSLVLDGFAAPAFTKRAADTTVELASGQTFAIAGLFQRDLITDTDKFPVLGDVPVLGQLFQSERFQRRETELVILITPYLVKPSNTNDIALPNDRLAPADRPANRRDGNGAGFIVN